MTVTGPRGSYDALLLVSFGGPEGPDDVVPFLENVTRGRGIPRERLVEVGAHYTQFGGASPINAQNRELMRELREDFAEHARKNVVAMLGDDIDYTIEIRDVTEGIDETGLDRILLDMPEPWKVVPHAVGALRPGGIMLCYLPTINQTAQLREALDAHGFGLAETVEILRRSWHIEARSVRPDHRMVAHTGFLTTARRLSVEPVEDQESISPAR